MKNLGVRGTLVWLGLFCLAFLNGALRELFFKRLVGIPDLPAHQLSVLTGIALWSALGLVSWRWLALQRFADAVWVGTGWLLATFAFETFVLNRNLSWEQVLQTYNIAQGEFWGLALLWVGLLPAVLWKVRGPGWRRKGR